MKENIDNFKDIKIVIDLIRVVRIFINGMKLYLLILLMGLKYKVRKSFKGDVKYV